MGNEKEKIIEALKRAILAERNGHYFYLMAAQTTKDPKGKEVFTDLAKEELNHMEYLQQNYRSVLEQGTLNSEVTLTKIADLSGPSPIFSESFKSRIGESHYEMTALSIGIELELNAMNYYRSQAEQIADPEAKKFFSELSDWEQGHYRALLRQQEEVKEDYWAQSGFAPF